MNIYTPEFQPTYLYIKQHTITGKLYFGKTTSNKPEKYPGSGTRWTNHINKHGKEYVVTLWYCLFLDKESIQEFAVLFSKMHNIGHIKPFNKHWLNLRIENGTDGGGPGPDSNAIRKSKKTKEINNSQFNSKGLASAKLTTTSEHLGLVPITDPRWSTGEICGIMKGIPSKRKKPKLPKLAKHRKPAWNKGLTKLTDPRLIQNTISEYNSKRTKCSCIICKQEVDIANFSKYHNH